MGAARLSSIVLACLALVASFPASAARFLAPHRAVYDLSLDKATDKSGITGIVGRMVYEFNGSACEGYTVNFRFVTQIDTSETSRLTDQQTTSFEDREGRTFDFSTRSFTDQEPDKEVKGTATREPSGISVKLEKPAVKAIPLGASQFPTQHLIEMLGKAEQGEDFYETTLFDGSDEADRIMTTSVVIGKPAAVKPEDPEKGALGSIEADPFWPVTIAYFDTGKQESAGEGLPTYRISFKLHKSGITRDLVMDYGDFSIRGKLVNLAVYKSAPEPCTPK